MLIYNYQKEFLGIDEKDLKTLGFKDLAGLRAEVTDFADLFVKTPGYVHNFKHVHWIDFIACAESSEESKVIINVNNKNYKSTVQITTAYLVDEPSSKAYMIHLNNLRELSANESEHISGDITQRESPASVATPQPIFNTPELSDEFDTQDIEEELAPKENVTHDPYEAPLEVDLDVDDVANEVLEEDLSVEEDLNENLNIDDLSLDVDFEDDLLVTDDTEQIAESVTEAPETQTQTVTESFDNGYIYNPQLASDELGLPLDLIEEFIQDFIAQAKEFKENLYKAVNEADLDNLKVLSHKLKGVAANLRIEDALETLTIINTTADFNVIEENLNIFYKIIAKLAGEEVVIQKEVAIQEEVQVEVPTPTETIEIEDDEDDLYADLVDISEEEITPLEEKLEIAIEEPEEELEQKLEIAIEEPEEELTIELEQPEVQEPTVTYSKETVANEIGIDNESFNELFDDYIEEAGQLTQTIQNALDTQDLQTCKNSALKLKGMSDNMRLTSFSTDLENIIHSNEIGDIQNSLNTITSAIAELSK